jgi:3-mercaptopyruvate sulfurtransferase SseA
MLRALEVTAAGRAVDFKVRGFENVRVLAGGFLAWIHARYDLTSTTGGTT